MTVKKPSSSDLFEFTPLSLAIMRKEENCALDLIEASDKEHLKLYRSYGDSYLMLAVKHELFEVVSKLIPYSDIDYKSFISHKTALHLAVHRKNTSIVTLLIENGANLTIEDRHNHTPVDLIKYFLSNINNYAEKTKIEDIAHILLSSEDMMAIDVIGEDNYQ
jgi:ankyrin repeat protein